MLHRFALASVAVGLLAFGAFFCVDGRSQASAASADGKTVYGANCASCHGATGAGIPGTFPPLAKNPDVTGNAGKVIHILKNGLTGALKVNGKTYNGQMPAWKASLSNAEIAAVVSYVRTSFGNKASKVTEKQVAAAK